MLKDSLREKRYTSTFVTMTACRLNISAWIFVTLFTFIEIVLTMYVKRIMSDWGIQPIVIPLPMFIIVPIFTVGMMYLYFIFISLITKFFCESKKNTTKLGFIEDIKMPACTCVEGLKPRQLITTYTLSILIILLLFAVFGGLADGVIFSIMAFFCAILLAPDASLVLYILHLKKRHRPDYIVVHDHLSNIVLFKR